MIITSHIDGLPLRDSGPWIHRKYFYLRKYIEIFTKGMGKKWKKLVYIDLFAGPGRCSIRNTNKEEDGSPLIALTYPFSRYVYVEKEGGNAKALEQRCKKSPKWSSVKIIEGDCNKVIDQVNLGADELSLAFIDPTGIDIHFDSIRSLTSNRRVDILMNIQFGMDIKRGFMVYKGRRNRSKLDRFLGGNIDWDYLNSPQDVLKIYKKQIANLGYTTVEYRDVVVKNTKNVPMYFLFFASKHPRGVDFWEKITRQDELGQLKFF